jgi:hypothetical protein
MARRERTIGQTLARHGVVAGVRPSWIPDAEEPQAGPEIFKPGTRIEVIAVPGRMGFVLYRSNVSEEMVVRFDGFAYNTVVPADPARYAVHPDEPFRD